LAKPGTRTFAALGVSFVLGIAGARFLFDSTPGETAPEARETSTATLPSSHVAAIRAPATTLPKPAQGGDTLDRPLPPLDAPFAEIVDALRERARNGDAESACRLAAEYALCASVPRQLSEFERWLAQRQLAIRLNSDPILLKDAEVNVRRELGPRERSISKIRKHCADVDLAAPAEIANDWLNAAKAGSLAAMKNFASGNAFRWDSILDVLPELSEYRTLAEPMAIEVAKNGDQEMMLALAAAYSPLKIGSRNLLAQTISPNREKSIALYRFILATSVSEQVQTHTDVKESVSDLIAELEALPGGEDPARIAEFMAEFQQEWRPFGTGFVTNNRSPRDGQVREISRADCARE
jgi:hypothetical protein